MILVRVKVIHKADKALFLVIKTGHLRGYRERGKLQNIKEREEKNMRLCLCVFDRSHWGGAVVDVWVWSTFQKEKKKVSR